MEQRAKILGSLLVLLPLVGCASSGGDHLQNASARAIGGNVSPDQELANRLPWGPPATE